MLTAQQRYSHISYQSEEWQAIADGVPDAFIWAQDDKSEDIRFSWGLLGKMLDDWSIHESTLLDKEVDETLNKILSIVEEGIVNLDACSAMFKY